MSAELIAAYAEVLAKLGVRATRWDMTRSIPREVEATPREIAAALVASPATQAHEASVWDEAAESVSEWAAFVGTAPPGPNGRIDPPANRYAPAYLGTTP